AAEQEHSQVLSATLEQIKDQIPDRDRTIQSLMSDALASQERQNALSEQLAEREAELARIKGSPGWQLLQAYGRIKYRHLLPLYRLLGMMPQQSQREPGVTTNPAPRPDDSTGSTLNLAPPQRRPQEARVPANGPGALRRMAHYLASSWRVRAGR